MMTTPASRHELLKRLDTGAKFNYELFWHGPLSQWKASPFTINGITYPTAEHWMMASKARVFNDQPALDAILAAKTPREAKALGAVVLGYNNDVWAAVRRDFVVYGNIAKFAADLELRRMLLNTGNAVLVEASPKDQIWGIGMAAEDERARDPRQWRGSNLLGFALMAVRDILTPPDAGW